MSVVELPIQTVAGNSSLQTILVSRSRRPEQQRSLASDIRSARSTSCQTFSPFAAAALPPGQTL